MWTSYLAVVALATFAAAGIIHRNRTDNFAPVAPPVLISNYTKIRYYDHERPGDSVLNHHPPVEERITVHTYVANIVCDSTFYLSTGCHEMIKKLRWLGNWPLEQPAEKRYFENFDLHSAFDGTCAISWNQDLKNLTYLDLANIAQPIQDACFDGQETSGISYGHMIEGRKTRFCMSHRKRNWHC